MYYKTFMRKEILQIQSYVLNRLTNFMYKNGFIWILPVILSKSTDPLYPDPSGSVQKSLDVEIYGQRLTLTQSMIVQKQYLISQGLDRIFILSPNIRIEKPERASTGNHLFEFTQLDFEIANADENEARKMIESMIVNSLRYIRIDMNLELKALGSSFRVPKAPFKTYRYMDLLDKYGENWEKEFAESIKDPVWVIDIPRYFYDMEDEYGVWHNYDLYVPKYGEILSGGQREYRYEVLVKKMDSAGVDKSKYSKLLELAKDNRLRPSAGAGLGIERFVRWIADVPHVKDVQPFPRVPGEPVEL
ncbi:MAG: asparagine synthetase A [Candidatus Anstonellales archaeon]